MFLLDGWIGQRETSLVRQNIINICFVSPGQSGAVLYLLICFGGIPNSSVYNYGYYENGDHKREYIVGCYKHNCTKKYGTE